MAAPCLGLVLHQWQHKLEEIAKQVDDIRSRPRKTTISVKVWRKCLRDRARETEEEAKAVLAEIIEKANPEAVNAFGHEVKNAASLPRRRGQLAQSPVSRTSSNTMMASAPISSDAAAGGRAHREPEAPGADLILLGFLHFQEEVEYFGKHVIPLVRELKRRKQARQSPPSKSCKSEGPRLRLLPATRA